MPGSLLTNISTGVITGFGGLYIFDRLMSDAVNHAWMSDYAAIISQSAANVSRALNTTNEAKWVAAFDKTLGGSIAKILFNMNSVLPESLVYWYPTSDFFSNTNRNKEKYWKTNQASSLFRSYPGLKSVVLYTPTVYSSGSSISHVDSILYEGSTEYLMRPYGTPGVSLDAYTPRGAYGPIGEHVLGILRGMGWATALGPVK